VRPVPFAPGQAGEPSWSPDGTQIAFAAGSPGGLHLWIMDFFTGDATPLTQDNTVSDNNPAWSPDGSKIAFTRCGGSPIHCDVWVVNADGTSPVNLTQSPGSDDMQPAWSPDGSQIAFSTNRDGNFEVYSMAANGSGALRLTDTPDQDTSPDWSPDGTLIAFARLDAQLASAVWTMNAVDGTNPLNLAPGEQPTYSPDGTHIAFVLVTGSNSDLWTMNADGTGGLALVATAANELAPSWQPVNAGTNLPPTAVAGADATFTCESEETAAVLDGTGSTDPDSSPGTNDDIVLYEWWIDFGTPTEEFLGTGAVIDQLGLASGTYNVTLQVSDSQAQTATDEVVITIDDQTPPQVDVSVSPSVLWPPNHRMVHVRSNVDAFDFCGPITLLALTSVTSNEPENAQGDGNTAPDIMGTNLGTEDFMFQVRAERSGTGTGRIYTVIYSATDPSGNVGEGSGEIKVPHDKGKGKGNGGQGSGGHGKGKDKGKGNGNGHGKH
jgi:WD40 repeat protein/K319-like protein